MIILYAVYALLLMAGGALGYARAKSLPSLLAGIGSAVLMGIAAGLLGQHHPHQGLGAGIGVSLVMMGFFVARFRATGKAMPALVIVTLSVAVLIVSIVRWIVLG